MSSWGQIVKSIKCHTQDLDCVLDRAGFSDRSGAGECGGHSRAPRRLERAVQLEAGSLGKLVQLSRPRAVRVEGKWSSLASAPRAGSPTA